MSRKSCRSKAIRDHPDDDWRNIAITLIVAGEGLESCMTLRVLDTGDVEGGGFFRLSSLNRAASSAELKYSSFDGDRIELASGTLVPIEPIRPGSIPAPRPTVSGI